MPQHLFYNLRTGFLAILFAVLIAEHFIDYEPLFEVSVKSRKQPELKSMGVIDQYIKQYDYAIYAHVIDDNIFSGNVIVEQIPLEKPTLNFIPFTIQLEVRGIAITPQRKMIMIWDKQKNQSQILLENEKLYEWRVASIEKHRVTLEHESGELYEFLVNEETLTNFNTQR